MVEKTNPYDILTGIDQREIISPLLWCIYYDPLLCQLQDEQLGYEISAKYHTDIYSKKLKESIIFPEKMYVDDMTILASNQKQLELMLSVADEFYDFNDIKINKDKLELLLRMKDTNFDYMKDFNIKFGMNKINITLKLPNESISILGVWFNVNDDKQFVI